MMPHTTEAWIWYWFFVGGSVGGWVFIAAIVWRARK